MYPEAFNQLPLTVFQDKWGCGSWKVTLKTARKYLCKTCNLSLESVVLNLTELWKHTFMCIFFFFIKRILPTNQCVIELCLFTASLSDLTFWPWVFGRIWKIINVVKCLIKLSTRKHMKKIIFKTFFVPFSFSLSNKLLHFFFHYFSQPSSLY